MYYSIMPLFFALLTGFMGGMNIVSSSYNKIAAKTQQLAIIRTGNEIYEAIFNKSSDDCLRVLNQQDQIVPGLDCCIWLEFETCPLEIRRILQLNNYDIGKVISSNNSLELPNFSEKPSWWNPKYLGDSVLFFKYSWTDRNREQLLYISVDSTHAFYYDILY